LGLQSAAVQKQVQEVASTTDGQAQLLGALRKNGVAVNGVQINAINGQAVPQPAPAVRPSPFFLMSATLLEP
jgi:hypothetical protein